MPRSSSFSEAPLRAPAVCREQSLAQAAPDAIRCGRLDGNGLDDRETARPCRRIAQGGEPALENESTTPYSASAFMNAACSSQPPRVREALVVD